MVSKIALAAIIGFATTATLAGTDKEDATKTAAVAAEKTADKAATGTEAAAHADKAGTATAATASTEEAKKEEKK